MVDKVLGIWRRIQAMGTARLHLDYNLRLLEEYKYRLYDESEGSTGLRAPRKPI